MKQVSSALEKERAKPAEKQQLFDTSYTYAGLICTALGSKTMETAQFLQQRYSTKKKRRHCTKKKPGLAELTTLLSGFFVISGQNGFFLTEVGWI